ncbi:MAG: arginine repressor [Lachnospiraceae bacterium]|jgi:transcriptional regulator of arginine metabolism|nr:arginine repressor [Lachnospiraceae bacterium]
MQTKKKRHLRILEIIQSRAIETQEDLAAALREDGFDVTQATVSRDIRELRLQKSRKADGRQYYVPAPDEKGLEEMEGKYVRVLKDAVTDTAQAQNILVVKTVSGMAMAVAAALDNLPFPEIVGCIAGDDTIFIAVKTAAETARLERRIRDVCGMQMTSEG